MFTQSTTGSFNSSSNFWKVTMTPLALDKEFLFNTSGFWMDHSFYVISLFIPFLFFSQRRREGCWNRRENDLPLKCVPRVGIQDGRNEIFHVKYRPHCTLSCSSSFISSQVKKRVSLNVFLCAKNGRNIIIPFFSLYLNGNGLGKNPLFSLLFQVV